MRRTPQTVFPFIHGIYTSPLVTVGHDGDQTSAGAFNRFTQQIAMFTPFVLQSVLWDIQTSDTYNLELVDSTAASPTIIKTLVSGQSLTGGGVENTFTFDPYTLKPGLHCLSLYCATARTQRRNAINVVEFAPYFMFCGVGYNGGSSTVGSIPAKLVGTAYINNISY